jgi:hypothetical protein
VISGRTSGEVYRLVEQGEGFIALEHRLKESVQVQLHVKEDKEHLQRARESEMGNLHSLRRIRVGGLSGRAEH